MIPEKTDTPNMTGPIEPTTTKDPGELAWNLFTELRKELLESQKIRAQVTGFKITFVTTSIAVIVTKSDKIPEISPFLLAIAAFSAIFFDFLIVSYSFSIKRIGTYCELFLEPIMKDAYGLPEDAILWQNFLKFKKTSQTLSIAGNIGITSLAVMAGIYGLLTPYKVPQSPILLALLAIFTILSIIAYWEPRSFRSINRNYFSENSTGESMASGEINATQDVADEGPGRTAIDD